MNRFSILKPTRHIQCCHSIGDKCTILKFVLSITLLLVLGCEKQEIEIEATETNSVNLSESDEYFQIAVLPDTQYYTALKNNGTMDMFKEQITWIRANKVTSRIAYVIHLGDVVEHGSDNNSTEWTRAKNELYKLEQDNIPYGVAVGNHDQTPYGNPSSPGTYNGYGVYFGRYHMQQFPWYGGAYGSSNNSDNHYDLFSANGTDYIVLYIEYNTPNTSQYSSSIENSVMNWADGILNTYSSRKAIIVSHSILRKPVDSNGDAVGYNDTRSGFGNNSVASNFTNQGQVIYDRMKHHDNVFLMLCGHIPGEGFRRDNYNGHIIKSYLSDYQSRRDAPYTVSDRNGGNGLMRLMKFNKTQQTLSVRTFAPRPGPNILEEDGDSKFTEPLYN